MKHYCYVIMNNAGHSWIALGAPHAGAGQDPNSAALPELLREGWEPVRETPMGGGTSPLAHSLILLERMGKAGKPGRPAKK